MAMDLGDAKITIKVDDKASTQLAQIGRNADAMGKKFRTMGKVMVGVGLAIAAALGAAVFAYAKAGDEIQKMALRTGFTTEALSELKHAADLSGASLAGLEKASRTLSGAILDAGYGLETYVRAFDQIGLSYEALAALNPEEQFIAVMEALAGVTDESTRAALATDLFGRAGTQLLPMLANGAEGLADMRQEAHDLGIVFDQVAADKAAALNDAMTRLKESLQGVMFAIADELVPVITEFLENKVIPVIAKIMDWIDANEGLGKTLLWVAGILIAGGALLLGLGMVSKAIVAINSALVIMHSLSGPTGWAILAAGIGVAAGAISAINALMAETPETAILTPEAHEAIRKGLEAGTITPAMLPSSYRLPSMQYGGIVPGPIGAPIPVMAHGGEEFAGVGKSFGRSLNVYIGSFMGDESSLRAFSSKLKEIMGQDTRRTSFSGINKWDYFSGSSAP